MQELKIWVQIINNKAGLEFHENIWYKDLVGAVLPVRFWEKEPDEFLSDAPIKERWKVIGEKKSIFMEDTRVLSMWLDDVSILGK